MNSRGRPPKKERMEVIQVVVPPKLKNDLQEAAARQMKTLSQYVREILERR